MNIINQKIEISTNKINNNVEGIVSEIFDGKVEQSSNTNTLAIAKNSEKNKYILEGEIKSMRIYGPRNVSVYSFSKDLLNEWVLLSGNGQERVLGYLYLKKILASEEIIKKIGGQFTLNVADTKMYKNEDSEFYFSRFIDGKRNTSLKLFSVIKILNEIGYTDTLANIYEENNKSDSFFVFDTEKGSFDKNVWNSKIATEKNMLKLKKRLEVTTN